MGHRSSFVALVALILISASLAASSGEIIDRVLAVAAGDVIMMSDVTAARDLGLVPAQGAADPIGAVLSQLIDRALMLAEVDRYAPPEPTPEAVNDELRLVRARFQSPQMFEAVLSRVGLDERRLTETLRQNLRIRAYLDQRFTADTPERRKALIDEWIAGLRRRADIIDLYVTSR